MEEKRTVTVEQAARLLGIGRNLAYQEAKNGSIASIPVIRVGKRLLLSRAALDRVLAGDDRQLAEAGP